LPHILLGLLFVEHAHKELPVLCKEKNEVSEETREKQERRGEERRRGEGPLFFVSGEAVYWGL
jgi:hypothetical protein